MNEYEKKTYPKKAKPISTHEKLRIALKNLYPNEWDDSWIEDLPKKWKQCQDLLILPANCFTLPHWSSNEFWKLIAHIFRAERVAQENRIKPDDFRSPNLTLLYGNDPIVVINNNGIKY